MIVLEPNNLYLQYIKVSPKLVLQALIENPLLFVQPLQAIDDRITIYEQSGYEWGVYKKLEDAGELDDVLKVPWTSGGEFIRLMLKLPCLTRVSHLVHPQLSFITHIPTTVLGEQLIAQLFRGIPDKQWLFQYGRVPLCFMMSSRMWKAR